MGLYNHRAPTEDEISTAVTRARMLTNENEPNLRAAVFTYTVAQLIQDGELAEMNATKSSPGMNGLVERRPLRGHDAAVGQG